jgi:flavin-dependent dehydrogenase
MLPWSLDGTVEASVSKSRWMLRHERTVEMQHPTLLMVSRKEFDLRFVEHALAVGGANVMLCEDFEVAGVEEDAQGVTVVGEEGERIRARYVIGADGAMGRVARSVGLARRSRPGAAIDAEVEVEPDVFEAERDRLTFNFSCVRNGYGWTFPKRGYLSLGVGSWSRPSRLPAAMDDYIARTLPAGSVRSVVRLGHPIPLWAGDVPLATRRVCLVGDAANLVDPILGEGIRFAVMSGRMAADVILALLGDEHPRGEERPRDCLAYSRQVESTLGVGFESLRQLVLPIFLKSPEFFFKKFYEEGVDYLAFARGVAARLSASGSAVAPPPA